MTMDEKKICVASFCVCSYVCVWERAECVKCDK